MNSPLLEVRNFSLDLLSENRWLPVLQNLDFDVKRGEILSLIGESGCGKSLTSLAITRLIPSNISRVVSGEILYQGKDLLKLSSEELHRIRGKEIAYVFQEPFAALNPLMKIGDQMIEGYLLHISENRKEALEKAEHLLASVGITDIKQRLYSYPNQMSGGILQRIGIAMALMCDPALLIADEPTSAIDVTIQAQLVELLTELQKRNGMSILFISHDFGLVGTIARRIAVMYAGRIAELGGTDSVIDTPVHPYTIDLLNSIPTLAKSVDDLQPISGIVPSPDQYPNGCHYSTRCKSVFQPCKESKPELFPLTPGSEPHAAACFLSKK
ncbi:ABC transporter ATP-binding protein [Leptospira gomenensis]|uniref:ABC transporter ATP-binding protein n=1 Tax=Leptospira gomenensis TaxID=2484974 RepID=A0A5F1Z192_9LEPT|nr:ABC transporter ATP-binding protein [Leptospira gomenensis]TGK27905.1 ABC transporter ATP-binding protein [Leptospira gomenensis]TGK45489.1 ABC transporter ATP-binding protein [Leptospira gomenensis]TGK45876.1 ABC transporter ATP-binding protein [Leptospira gomenensis]TGK65198.1 ABC transporter ATP-binding protein [Leptospira gomenensis]